MADGDAPPRMPWWYLAMESFVVRVGFPAAVATFVLVKLDSSLRELTLTVHALAAVVARCGK